MTLASVCISLIPRLRPHAVCASTSLITDTSQPHHKHSALLQRFWVLTMPGCFGRRRGTSSSGRWSATLAVVERVIGSAIRARHDLFVPM